MEPGDMDDLFEPSDGRRRSAPHTRRRSKPSSGPPGDQSSPQPTSASAAAVGPEECRIIRFPASVWAPRLWSAKVEIAAQTLVERKTERGRSNYWTRVVDTLAAQMLRRGATEIELNRQLDDFRDAVQAAMSREHGVTSTSRDDKPRGAT
jgi:hypothetical protein